MVATRKYKNRLASLIKNKRKQLNISKREFARRAKFKSHDTVTRLESGEYLDYPARETLEKLAYNVFDVTVTELEQMIEPVGSTTLQFDKLVIECEQLENELEILELIKILCNRLDWMLRQK